MPALTGRFTPAAHVPEVKANLVVKGCFGKDVRSGVRRFILPVRFESRSRDDPPQKPSS
jgi:hypothetical protein